jgi:DDE superfamily endonuclease
VPGQAFSRRVPARVRWGSSVIAAAPALTRAVHEVRPLLAGRGYATPQGQRLSTLADVFAYATACGIRLRIAGSEIQVRRPPPRRPGRRALVSGKKKINTIKFTKICDERGRTLRDGTFRPGRQHDQTALKTDGIDGLLDQFPVAAEMDAGYRGLHRDHPGQVSVPPKKPAKDAPPEVTEACERARHSRSSQRICAGHAIADSKNWQSVQRWTGRREYLPETIQAIGSLVSGRAAAR